MKWQLYAKILAMPHILLVKTSSMGDIVHNMPVIADILEHVPNASIDWVVEESFAELVALHPAVNRIIPIAMRRWKKALTHKITWQQLSAFRHSLQAMHYDAVLDTQGLLKSALISRLAHGPSYGANRQTAREAIAGTLYQHPRHIPQNLHASVRSRMLAAKALGYAMPQTPPVYNLRPPPALPAIAVAGNYAVGLHSTARDSKLWPSAYWIELGQFLAAQGLRLLLPWGSAGERARAEQIAAAVPDAAVLPKMCLTELASLIADAKLAVGLDTGLMHLAVALGIPTLAIFTDTEIWQAGTYPPAHSKALTIGGKRLLPAPAVAIEAIGKLLPLH
ncbi:MAG TPA: lipopolysaccharide heptosyltransferase I [Methylophilaceae bacterium]|nr:lipopolysaccharide heptosyltransferase I [Methylophilaceae bacterium]